jgi:hypothetical protein
VKYNRLTITSLVIIGGVLFCSPVFVYAQTEPNFAPKWQAGLSFSFLTGDYSQDDTSEMFYSAASIKRYLEKGDITLTVPYINISSDGTTFIDGEPMMIPGADGGSGLGDIILKGRYYAIEQDQWLPYIDLVGSIKFPTADEDKGLGTGKTDFTFMAEFTRKIKNTNWTALGELGYTFVGEPSGYNTNNRWLYSAGLAYQYTPQIILSGYLDGRTAIFEGNDDPLSILLAGQYKYRPDILFDLSLEVGLNDGAPDMGITFGVRKRF